MPPDPLFVNFLDVLMQLHSSVQTALERCYAAFAHYPLPNSWDFSPYKDGDGMLRELRSAPLPDLTGEQIGPYAGSAILTVGDVNDYKHFLPRILEQTVRDPVWLGADPVSLSAMLVNAEWQLWPEEERNAVLSLFHEGFLQTLQEHPDHSVPNAEEWFSGMMALGEDAAEALRNWTAVPSAHAALQLARMVSNARSLFRDSRVQDLPGEAPSVVRHWLLNDALQAFLVEASVTVEESDQWNIEAAFDELDKLRATHLSSR